MAEKVVYRVIFYGQDCVYDIYAKSFAESELFGFLEVEELVFGETTSVVVDPSQERLQREFSDVKRCYIPINSILRIDEVKKEGVAKIRDITAKTNVKKFPGVELPPRGKED